MNHPRSCYCCAADGCQYVQPGPIVGGVAPYCPAHHVPLVFLTLMPVKLDEWDAKHLRISDA